MECDYSALMEKDSQFDSCNKAALNQAKFNTEIGIVGAQSLDVYKLCTAIWKLHRNCKYSVKVLNEGKSYRFLWYNTAQFLYGTTYIYRLHVKFCYDEAERLLKSFDKPFFLIKTTQSQTIKRKTEEIISKGSKRKCTEIQIENFQTFAYWEEEKSVNEDDFAAAWGKHTTDDRNITLCEDDYPILATRNENENEELPSFTDTEDFQEPRNSGRLKRTRAEKTKNLITDDTDMLITSARSSPPRRSPSPNLSEHIPMSGIENGNGAPEIQPVENIDNLVENMMDASEISINQEIPEIPEIPEVHEKPKERDDEQEVNVQPNDSLNDQETVHTEDQQPKVLKKVTTKKGKKSKRLAIDEQTELEDKVFHRQLANPYIYCNKSCTKDVIEVRQLQQKGHTFFHTPAARDSSVTLQLYNRNLMISDQDRDTTDILRLILNGTNDMQNELDTMDAVVRSQRSRTPGLPDSQPRRSKRLNKSSKGLPMSPGQNNELELFPQQQTLPEEIPDIVLPPLEFDQNNNNSIDNDINNNNTASQDLANSLPASSEESNTNIDKYLEKNTPDDTGFCNDNNEVSVLKLLSKLWKKNVHPIGMDKINRADERRVRAAKNFASLLVLEKRRFIRIEHVEDKWEIYHIDKGDALNSELNND